MSDLTPEAVEAALGCEVEMAWAGRGHAEHIAACEAAARAWVEMMRTADREYICAYGTRIVEPPDEDGDCKGCSGRQAIRGCGWVLVVPDES